MKTIVVTGATSMIGVATIEACLENSVNKIYAVIRPGTTKLDRMPVDNRIEFVECDAELYRSLPNKIHEVCDVFYHIAWSVTGAERNKDILGQANNIRYTIDAVNAAKELGCTKFVGAGSQAEYGKLVLDKINEKSPVNPVQPYGIAKYAAGKLGSEEAKRIGLDFFWIRIFSIYGKNDKPSTMISSSVKKLLHGEHTEFTAAEQRWDYLNCKDAGRAFYLVGEKGQGNKVYCLGYGEARPLHEYIEIIGKIIDPSAKLGIGEIPYTSNTVMNLCADITELENDVGYKPTIKFEEGIKEYIEEMKVYIRGG